MGEWDQMAEYVSRLDDGDETKLRGLGNTPANGDGSSSGTFFRAVLLVRRGKVPYSGPVCTLMFTQCRIESFTLNDFLEDSNMVHCFHV